MRKIIIAIIAVTAFLMSGCKSPSIVIDANVERELLITAKSNSTTLDEVMKACCAMDIINVGEYYTGMIYEPENENPFIQIKNNESSPIVTWKLTFKTNSCNALKQTRNSLLRLDGVLRVDIK